MASVRQRPDESSTGIVASVVYPVMLTVDVPGSGWRRGPAPVIESAVWGSDERTDRSRTLPPHVADLVLGQRWHIEADQVRRGSMQPVVEAWRQEGLRLCWVEVLRFISEADADVLRDVGGGDYPELYTGLGVLHFLLDGGRPTPTLSGFTSRADQHRHNQVRMLFEPVADIRVETADRLMDPSELPFVLIGSVHDDKERAHHEAGALLMRDPSSAVTVLDESTWRFVLWNDAVLCCAQRLEDQPFRLANRTTWVASSFLLDAVLLRFAQRHALEMLARRTADGAASIDRQAKTLHGAALRVRSKLWWPKSSPEPLIDDLSRAMSAMWGLESLAESVFFDVTGLAQHAELAAAERLNRILMVLTAGA
jgi:hypothetical protein